MKVPCLHISRSLRGTNRRFELVIRNSRATRQKCVLMSMAKWQCSVWKGARTIVCWQSRLLLALSSLSTSLPVSFFFPRFSFSTPSPLEQATYSLFPSLTYTIPRLLHFPQTHEPDDIQLEGLRECCKSNQVHIIFDMPSVGRLRCQLPTVPLVVGNDMVPAVSSVFKKYQINRLQHIQNALARTVVQAPKFQHITPILKSRHWLKVSKRIECEIISLAKFSVPLSDHISRPCIYSAASWSQHTLFASRHSDQTTMIVQSHSPLLSTCFTSSLEPASYITQDSSSKLFIPHSATFI